MILRLILVLLIIPVIGHSQVWVYQYPDVIVDTEQLGKNIRSDKYKVQILQGEKVYDSYVLADYNTFPGNQRQLMTDWNHSTTFSFEGKVRIEISRLDGNPPGNCSIFPQAKNIPFNIEEGKLIITLEKPMKMYVELEGMERDPLFIFADPPELNIPSKDDPDVLVISPGVTGLELRELIQGSDKNIFYFEEGIHSFGSETGSNYEGYQIPVISNRHYYIPGGAYIIGSFRGHDVSNTKFTGRGIISACGKERLANSKSIPYNLIMLDGDGTNQLVEGLTFTNPAHFILLSRGSWSVRNTKMFGWWHQTDGWGGGDHSLIEDSFLKVNDDYVKMYNTNQVARDLLVYKQINGAVIQLGWNQGANGLNCLAENIYVVKDADKIPRDISNTAVINLRNNAGNNISNFHIRNLYMESNVQRILGIEMRGGTMENFVIEEVYLKGKNRNFNYLFAHEGAVIRNFILKNWYYFDEKVLNDESSWMKREGRVENVRYE